MTLSHVTHNGSPEFRDIKSKILSPIMPSPFKICLGFYEEGTSWKIWIRLICITKYVKIVLKYLKHIFIDIIPFARASFFGNVQVT